MVTGDRGHLTVLTNDLCRHKVRGVLHEHQVTPLKQQVGEEGHAHGGPSTDQQVLSGEGSKVNKQCM